MLPADPVLDQGGSNLAGLLPSPGNGQPIRQIAYRGGLVCRIGALTEMTNKGLPCAPPGYERPVVALPPPRLVAARSTSCDASTCGSTATERTISTSPSSPAWR